VVIFHGATDPEAADDHKRMKLCKGALWVG
jgi:hypothetical protein